MTLATPIRYLNAKTFSSLGEPDGKTDTLGSVPSSQEREMK